MTQSVQIERARAAKARHQEGLLKKANVVAVGVGFRELGGVPSGHVCIIVSVCKKIPLSELKPRDVIPLELDGVPVDVRATGEIRAL